jgi:hypothetical protein
LHEIGAPRTLSGGIKPETAGHGQPIDWYGGDPSL